MSIQINLPEGLRISAFELQVLLAAKLFEEDLITFGQGAAMVGMQCMTESSARDSDEYLIFELELFWN